MPRKTHVYKSTPPLSASLIMEGDRYVRPKAAPRTALAEGEGVAMVCVHLLFEADDNKVIALTGVVFSPAGCSTTLPKS